MSKSPKDRAWDLVVSTLASFVDKAPADVDRSDVEGHPVWSEENTPEVETWMLTYALSIATEAIEQLGKATAKNPLVVLAEITD